MTSQTPRTDTIQQLQRDCSFSGKETRVFFFMWKKPKKKSSRRGTGEMMTAKSGHHLHITGHYDSNAYPMSKAALYYLNCNIKISRSLGYPYSLSATTEALQSSLPHHGRFFLEKKGIRGDDRWGRFCAFSQKHPATFRKKIPLFFHIFSQVFW